MTKIVSFSKISRYLFFSAEVDQSRQFNFKKCTRLVVWGLSIVHTIQTVNPTASGDTVPELRLAPTSEECEDSKFTGDCRPFSRDAGAFLDDG